MRNQWSEAHAKRRHDAGTAVASFRRQWESPGIVYIPTTGEPPKMLHFLKDATRDKYKRKQDSLRSRHFRNQRYAPPQNLPVGTVSVFTDGSAKPRKLGEHYPPAGWGVVAVQGGQGHEHKNGTAILKMCGPVNARTPNVRNGTNNSAELVAFTRALQWACNDEAAQGRPICMRYDSCYAAMIASGSWKAKAHKELAAEARAAWTALRQRTDNRLWMRHVRGHSNHKWNHTADRLAADGASGRDRYEAYPSV